MRAHTRVCVCVCVDGENVLLMGEREEGVPTSAGPPSESRGL